MRAVKRPVLDAAEQADLDRRQVRALEKLGSGQLDAKADWKAARQSKTLKSILKTLQRMMGDTQRCMYCLDSHGADIDHFWPKTPYPERMFRWHNLLLCCTECGRLKGDKFPFHQGEPSLIDPTGRDPWLDLDFDPRTGNIVARFDVGRNTYAERGCATVAVLQLDRREALAAVYRRTFKKLSATVRAALEDSTVTAEDLLRALTEEDIHGLLGWCIEGNGENEAPFSELRDQRPELWMELIRLNQGS